MTKIEQLESKTSQIKDDLNKLKNDVNLSEEQKREKAQEIFTGAKDIELKINELESQTWERSQRDTDRAKLLLKNFEEVKTLYNDIMWEETRNQDLNQNNTNQIEDKDQTTNTPTSEVQNEDKSILWTIGNWFWSAKEWIWNQWSDIWNTDKRKEDWLKNWLRTAWFAVTWVWAIALLWKWAKKTWNWLFWSDDEEEEESDKKSEKKRWFLSKAWSVIKWTAVGVWWAFWINRLGKKLWRRGTEPNATSSAEDQVKASEKLKEEDPEKFEKYHELWENIDSQYNQLMGKEISAWRWRVSIADWYKKYCDSSKLSLEDFKATVPMCVDNQFSSVWNMLSEAGYYAYLRSKNFKELKDALLKMIGDWSDKLIWSIFPFFGCLKSFERYKDKDFLEGIKTWLDDWAPTERCEELQLFFRQYAKVLSYAQDKRFALIEKIAKRKLDAMNAAWVDTSKYATINDAINDEEWFEENIKSDSDYINFMEWKLTGAIDVMKKESLFDDKLSEWVEEIKTTVDSYREDVLNEHDWKDALWRLKENKNALNGNNYSEWMEVIDKVCKDVDESFEKDWTYMYFSFAHTLTNSDEKNIQEFLENSWLKAAKNELKSKLLEFKTKFKNKSITADEVEGYSDLVNSYFAMKKEIMVAAKAIQTMKSEDPSIVNRALSTWAAILHDLWAQWKKAYESTKKWDLFEAWLYSTFPLITLGWVTKLVWKNNKLANKLWNCLLKVNAIGAIPWAAQWAYKLWGNVLRRTSHINWLSDWMLVHWRYNVEHWDELLFQDVLEWRISWTKAENVIKKWRWEKKRSKAKKVNSLEELLKTVWWLDSSTNGRVLTDLFKTKVQIWGKEVEISFVKNEEIRKIIYWVPTWTTWKMKSVFNWYYRRIYGDFSKIEWNAKHLWFWELFWWTDWGVSKIENLSENQLIFLKRIVEDWNFTDPTKQLKNLLDNIDKIDLNGITEDNLIKVIEEIWSNATDLEDVAKIQNKVNKFKGVDNIPQQRLKQPIFSEIDNTKWVLQNELNKTSNAAKRQQIQKQINQLEDFKNEMWKMPDAEFKKMDSLLSCFELNWTRKNLNWIITDVTKLKKIIDTGSHLTVGENWVTKSIDDIIKNLDADWLRKAIKFNSWIADELEDVAKIFEHIKVKNMKNVLWNADDVLRWLKFLVKTIAQVS